MGDLKAKIDSERAVHLCLDMQRLFAEGGIWATPWLERVLPVIARLAAHATERTVFTRFIPPETPDDAAGMWRVYFRKWTAVTRSNINLAELELVPELQRCVPPATIIDKPAYSAFSNTGLHGFLQGKHVNTLVVSGGETDVCVLSTVLSAVDQGYRVIVAKDGLCSSADQTHDALLTLYAQRFDLQIELAQTDEIIADWPHVSG